MKKIVIIGLGIAVLLAVVLAVGIWLFQKTPLLDATLSVPPEVELNKTVPMVIKLTNPHNAPVTLDSIDIDDSFLAGFQIVAIDPQPGDTSHISISGQRTWEFDKPLSPGDSLAVTFTIRAVSVGRFTGDVDVCNPTQNSKTVRADVIVKEPSSKKPPDADSD